MRNNVEERKATENEDKKVDKKTATMIDRAFVIEALRNRIFLLIGLTVGYYFLFSLIAPDGGVLERFGTALLIAVMTYIPFGISFAITVGIFSRIAVGFIILCVLAYLTEGYPVILGLILFGGAAIDFVAAFILEQ